MRHCCRSKGPSEWARASPPHGRPTGLGELAPACADLSAWGHAQAEASAGRHHSETVRFDPGGKWGGCVVVTRVLTWGDPMEEMPWDLRRLGSDERSSTEGRNPAGVNEAGDERIHSAEAIVAGQRAGGVHMPVETKKPEDSMECEGVNWSAGIRPRRGCRNRRHPIGRGIR